MDILGQIGCFCIVTFLCFICSLNLSYNIIREIQGSGLEGPIPESISLLTNLSQLAISDLNGEGSQLFPNLSSMASMKKLVLRGCNLRGFIPGYIKLMSKLQHLDLSFNDLGGDIPDLSGLRNLEKM
ncbi:putative non-specific serine/threonine protein kinase [Helianthus annuus]|uniref:Non-specific serine/threonine protein kinase n=1 Tax=Helianthus annuus TaxID=4232 RepID=A0A251RZN9_HELAN|nr:putative non-specific serine/threonine protein kinase [Helianthus annuus]KAJ0822034.1 putative non-specific serine/threonine protein kinase [Helianthus annuus]